MKIVMIGPVRPYRGGIATHTACLADALAQRHEVRVISFARQYPRLLYPGSSDREPNALAPVPGAHYLLDPLNPLTWRAARREIDAFAPDLVVLAWWTTFWAPAYAWLARALARDGIRLAAMVHNALPHEPRRMDRALATLALSPVTRFLVHTDQERARLQAVLAPREGARYAVCPLPVFPAPGEPAERGAARAQFGLPDDAHALLFFGLVRAYKGLDTLIDALALLHKSDPRHRLIVAGEFWEDAAAYRARIAQLGLGAAITILEGYVSEPHVPALFAAADTFVAPYARGTQSAAVALALGYGLPVVASDSIAGGIPPAARARVGVFHSGDPADLARVIGLMRGLPRDTTNRVLFQTWQDMVDAVEALTRDGA